MNTRPHALPAAFVAAMILILIALPALAGPDKGGRKAERAVIEAHLKLADYYMLDGQYGEALKHFEAIIDTDLKLPEDPDPGAEAFGKDRRKGGKGVHVKVRAHVGAAIAAHKAGDPDKAERIAAAGIELARAHGVKRGVKVLERFLDDPDEVADRAAPTLKALKARLEVAQKRTAGP